MSKNNVGRVAAVVVLLFLVVGSAAPAQADFPTPAVPGWKLEYLDHQRNFSNLSNKALAYDKLNHAHIVYGGDGLYHAWYNGSYFQVEVVDPSLNVGQHASIAIDPDGFIHIAYYDAGHGDLKYATNISHVWTTQTVITAGDVGVETAIFVDSYDVPYILYMDDTNNRLMFICGTPNFPMVWEEPELASVSGSTFLPYKFSAVMKNNLEVFMTYGNITANEVTELHYAHRSALGQWTDTVMDSGTVSHYVGHDSAIALNSLGYPWIVYSDNNYTGYFYYIRMIRWNGSSWDYSGPDDTFETYDASGALAMAINQGNNHLYMAYQVNKTLLYVEWDGVSWANDFAIEDDSDTGYTPSMALDSAGLPGVSYFDQTSSEIHYRKKSNISWSSLYYVDVSQTVGQCPVVKLDSQDRPHVIYYDYLFKSLRYKEYGTQWSLRWPVAPARDGTLECQSALALTSAGLPRVAYHTFNNLYFATSGLPFTGFINETLVDTDAAAWIQFVSMALDSSGYPHIVYTKNDKLYHAFDDGTGWQIEAIRDKNSQVQQSATMTAPSLVIDANNNLDLAFGNDSGLFFIARTSGGWQTAQQVSTSLPWNGISLVLAPPLNLPMIAAAYAGQQGNPEWIGLSAMFCFISCSWSTSVVNTAVEAYASIFNFTSVALAADHKGVLTISYLDDDNAPPNGLVVARNVGGQWVNQHIDVPTKPGLDESVSLAVTASGKARIAYYDGISRDLRFAWEFNRIFIPRVRK